MTPKERLEQILGGEITPHNEQPLPGIDAVDGTDVYYVADTPDLELGEQLKRLVRRVEPARLKNGGVVGTKHALRTPDGVLFHAFTCRGDLQGWKQQIEEGAMLLGLTLGTIEGGTAFVTSSGQRFGLDLCSHVYL